MLDPFDAAQKTFSLAFRTKRPYIYIETPKYRHKLDGGTEPGDKLSKR